MARSPYERKRGIEHHARLSSLGHAARSNECKRSNERNDDEPIATGTKKHSVGKRGKRDDGARDG
jgi:hypothetical protein